MAEAKKKQNFFIRAGKRISRWSREMLSELKKVVWPTAKQVINNSIVVLVMVAIVAAVVGLFDKGATEAVKLLINTFS